MQLHSPLGRCGCVCLGGGGQVYSVYAVVCVESCKTSLCVQDSILFMSYNFCGCFGRELNHAGICFTFVESRTD